MANLSVLVAHEKHEDRIIAADPDLKAAALKLLTERYESMGWYDNWDDGNPDHQWKDRAKAIVEAGDGKAAWEFLAERSDFEYEGIEIKSIG